MPDPADDALNAAMAIVHHLEPRARAAGTNRRQEDGQLAQVWFSGCWFTVELMLEVLPADTPMANVTRLLGKPPPSHCQRFNLWLVQENVPEHRLTEVDREGEPLWARDLLEQTWRRVLSVRLAPPALETVCFIRGNWEAHALAIPTHPECISQ